MKRHARFFWCLLLNVEHRAVDGLHHRPKLVRHLVAISIGAVLCAIGGWIAHHPVVDPEVANGCIGEGIRGVGLLPFLSRIEPLFAAIMGE